MPAVMFVFDFVKALFKTFDRLQGENTHILETTTDNIVGLFT